MDLNELAETGRQSPEETALAQILGFAGQLLAFFSPSLGGGGPIGVGIALIAVIGKKKTHNFSYFALGCVSKNIH